MNEKIVEAINQQINLELYSAYLYYALSDRALRMNFPGSAHWFDIQSREELIHAVGLSAYLQSRHTPAKFTAVQGPDLPPADSPGTLFELAARHERTVTERIDKLAELAHEHKDFAFAAFICYYLAEQTEEEYSIGLIAGQFKLAGHATDALLSLDQTLYSRTLSTGLPASPGETPGKK